MQENTEAQMQTIQNEVRDFILEEFLPGEDPEELTPTTPLFTSGILDSISTIKLVAFLEDHFEVTFAAHEMSATQLDTLSDIAETVHAKRA